jgi:hypothetical protein
VSEFVEHLRASLPRHAEALAALRAGVEADDRWRWLELGCSVAAGRGDERSDLDLALGARCPGEDDLPVAEAEALVRRVGSPVDLLVHRMDRPAPHRRIAAELTGGLQLDLVVMPAGNRPGLPPGSVALVDKDGTLARPWRPDAMGPPSHDQLREWVFLGWWALSDVAKYLARGSPFEAADRIAEARRLALQLHAAAQGIDYPWFGLTALLDEPQPALPMWLEETYGAAEPQPLAAAARATARLLRDGVTAVELTSGVRLDVPLAGAVLARLDALGS